MGKQVGNKKKKSDKSLFKYVPVYPKAPMDMKYHYYDDNDEKYGETKLIYDLSNSYKKKDSYNPWFNVFNISGKLLT